MSRVAVVVSNVSEMYLFSDNHVTIRYEWKKINLPSEAKVCFYVFQDIKDEEKIIAIKTIRSFLPNSTFTFLSKIDQLVPQIKPVASDVIFLSFPWIDNLFIAHFFTSSLTPYWSVTVQEKDKKMIQLFLDFEKMWYESFGWWENFVQIIKTKII